MKFIKRLITFCWVKSASCLHFSLSQSFASSLQQALRHFIPVLMIFDSFHFLCGLIWISYFLIYKMGIWSDLVWISQSFHLVILWYLNVQIIVPQNRKDLFAARSSKRQMFPNVLPIVSFPSFHFVCVSREMEKIVQRRQGGCMPHCWPCNTLTLGRDLKWLGILKVQSSTTLSHLGFQFHFQIIGWFPDKYPDWLAFTQGPTQPSLWHLLIDSSCTQMHPWPLV